MTMARILILLVLCSTLSLAAQVSDSDTIHSLELQEVIVSGERPKIKSNNGILSVDISSIVKDKPISNIYEALSFVPGIISNSDGGISLSGGNGLNILINGKKPHMPVENIIALLQSYPVEKLKGVDILYSTPAKYHVNGSSINIRLKEASMLDGLQGQARIDYEQKHYAKGSANIASSYSNGRISTDIMYRYTIGKSWAHNQIISTHTIGDNYKSINQEENTSTKGQNHNAHFSLGWNISPNNKITTSYDLQISPIQYATNHSFGSLGRFTTDKIYPKSKILHNVNISYESSFGLSTGATITTYKEASNTQLLSDVTNTILNDYNSSQNIKRYHLFIDQIHNIADWEINYGGSLDISHDYSSQAFNLDSNDSFSTKIRETSMDIYVGTEHSFDNGLGFSLSIQGDYYNRKGETKWWISPQIALTYMKTPKHIFQLDVSSSKESPSYWEIHGGKTLLNNYMMIMGNPNLRPSYTYESQLVYLHKQKYMAVLYYRYTDDYFAQLPYQSSNSIELIYQTQNFKYNQMLGLMIQLPFSFGKVMNSSLTLNGYYTHVKGVNFNDINFNTEKYSIYAELDNSIKLLTNKPLYLNVTGTVLSPSLQGYANLSSIWKLDIGAKWTFLKGNADFIIKWSDIFNTWSPTMCINKYGQNLSMKSIDLTSYFKATFTYRFNGFKPKNITIDQARFGIDK